MKSILEQLTITEDPARVDLDKVCSLLCNSYWAKERSREIIEKSIQNSIPISVFANDVQIGFARVLTIMQPSHGFAMSLSIRNSGEWALAKAS